MGSFVVMGRSATASSLRAKAATNLPTRFLGIDLAWSEQAHSGVCAIEADGRILDEAQLPPVDLESWVRRWRGRRSILALDGPLVVPPQSPAMRPVERELHRRYARYRAGPFPGGAGSLAMRGRSRSPAADLVSRLGDTEVDPGASSAHRAIEVFPAPAWIELFGLEERVVYKRGTKARRVESIRRLLRLLSTLKYAQPPLRATEPSQLDRMIDKCVTMRDWKAVEDVIDARLCAYIGLGWERIGGDPWVVTGEGTWREGYVVIPDRAAVRTDA